MIGKTQKIIESFFIISFELEYFGHYFKGQFRLGDNIHYCTISKCEQIRGKLPMCWHLPKIFLMGHFILLVQWLLIMTCFHLEFLQNISHYIINSIFCQFQAGNHMSKYDSKDAKSKSQLCSRFTQKTSPGCQLTSL